MILRSLLMMDLPASADPERMLSCELPLGLGVEAADVGGLRPVAGSRVNIDVPLLHLTKSEARDCEDPGGKVKCDLSPERSRTEQVQAFTGSMVRRIVSWAGLRSSNCTVRDRSRLASRPATPRNLNARGGSGTLRHRSANRNGSQPDNRSHYVGFRLSR